SGAEELRPEKATILGATTVIPEEYPEVRCRTLELALPLDPRDEESALREILTEAGPALVALRGGHRWERGFDPLPLGPQKQKELAPLRQGGVYLVTGGLGTLGLAVAGSLFE